LAAVVFGVISSFLSSVRSGNSPAAKRLLQDGLATVKGDVAESNNGLALRALQRVTAG
jgi:hypothetical protein